MIKNIQADSLDFGYYGFHVAAAIDKGEVVESFVNQVKHPLNFTDANQFRPSIP
jgi:hypothetical protein